MGKTFQYQESLEETALTEIFANIYRHRVPGLFEIVHGKLKRIYINDGNVIHASSTDHADRLGAYLYRTGKLTREQLTGTRYAICSSNLGMRVDLDPRDRIAYRELDDIIFYGPPGRASSTRPAALPGASERPIQLLESSDKRHGQILIEEALLSPGELYEAICRQVESIVWSVFAWQTGEVTFKIGEFHDPLMIKIHLPMRQAIVRGVKQVPDTKALVARLGKKSTVFRPAYCPEDLIEIALEADEYALLRLVDGQRTLFEICTDGPFNASENARLLYAYRTLQLIEPGSDASSASGIKIRDPSESSQ